jgi:hypothetical protein
VCRRHPASDGRRLSRALAAAAVLGLLSGCAIDTVGTLAARVTHADAAVVVDVYTVGAHLRTRAEDRGMTIGLGRRSYVFAAADADDVPEGWHLLAVPLPVAGSVAQHLGSLGLEARVGPVDYGVTLGLRVVTLIARIPQDASMTLALDYAPAHPERTRLQLCREPELCAVDGFFSD